MSPATPAKPLLDLEGLTVALDASGRRVPVEGVSLQVGAGETVCLVGESGCGKSMTGLACMGLLPPGSRIRAGALRYRGQDLSQAEEAQWRQLRGNALAMVFQEPMTSLNPVFTLGRQVAEPLRVHRGMDRTAAWEQAVALLDRVGIERPRQRLTAYPDELSGGQRQRVMIAMALACDPGILIADEPTTALDVTIQAHILELLQELTGDGSRGMLFITHDFGVAEEVADRVAVMYAGQIVEYGPTEAVLNRPRHPYTVGLLASTPGEAPTGERLPALGGRVPELGQWPSHCRFAERCPMARPRCWAVPVPLAEHASHASRCLYADEVRPEIWH